MVSHPAYANNRQQAVAAERIGAPCRLLSLADELILAIIERIDSHETLVNLCATCPRLQALTEPYSFKSRLVRTGDQAERLAHVLMSRMERLDYVKVLSIRYVWEDEQGIEILSDLMKIGLHNIRDLTIESPCLNNDPWRNDPQLPWRSACRIDIGGMLRAAALRSDPVSEIPVLPHLQSLTLHTHGWDNHKFSIGANFYAFLVPTLRNLTISCCDLLIQHDEEDPPYKERFGTTSLTTLTFIECNISTQLLGLILSYPKALKHLAIGERLYRFREGYPDTVLGMQHEQFVNMLLKQKHSLQSIKHIGGVSGFRFFDQIDGSQLQKFEALEEMEVGFESVLRFYIQAYRAPDTLKKLRLYGFMPDNAFVWTICRDLALHRLPKTCHLEVCLSRSNHADPTVTLPVDWKEQEKRNLIYHVAKPLKQRGARFTILGERFEGGRIFIPPYLYGEDTPVEVLLYDSEDWYRFAGTNYIFSDDPKAVESVDLNSTLVQNTGVNSCI